METTDWNEVWRFFFILALLPVNLQNQGLNLYEAFYSSPPQHNFNHDHGEKVITETRNGHQIAETKLYLGREIKS